MELISDFPNADIAVSSGGGVTNALGEFRTTVTSTVAGTFTVTPIVEGIVGTPISLTFVPFELSVSELNVN